MADIEMVIKLSEKNCEYIKRLGTLWIESEKGSSIVLKAILDGTLLPKGHGRLKDVDHYIKMQWEHPDYSLTDDEPTIIEADKAESEDKAK